MKKYVLIVMAALAFAACTKNELKVQPEAISFQTIVGQHGTRAMINGTEYPTSESFGSAAFLAETGDVYIPQSEVKFGSPVNGKWTTLTPYYWPEQGKTLSFFSYSPYKYGETEFPATINANGVVTTAWDVDANQTVDFMVADAVSVTVGNNVPSAVATVFRHKLSQVVAFKLASSEAIPGATKKPGDIEFIVKKISIKNVAYKGAFTGSENQNHLNLGAWNAADDKKSYVWYENATGTVLGGTPAAINPNQAPISANNYLLILPQDFTAASQALIEIVYDIKTYTGATTFTIESVTGSAKLFDVHQADHMWNMNKKITYTVTIGMDQDRRILWEPSVIDWEEETHTINVNA